MTQSTRDQTRDATQSQFLAVVSKEEAEARFAAAFEPATVGVESVPLAMLLGRILAADVVAPIDLPPFDRAVVDGFAVSSVDVEDASESSPVSLRLGPETLSCGTSPSFEVAPGTATLIATGAPVPRGADAVVMVEWTDVDGDQAILIKRAVGPGAGLAFAGSDVARGETVMRTGTRITSREIGILAALGLASVAVFRRPRVGVISTGDELVAPGEKLAPALIYDSNSAILAATIAENGGDPVAFGVIRDDEPALTEALRRAVESCDMVILSGGTSKGSGDFSHRVVGQLGAPGIIVHGVALKPGKPLVLAVSMGKPIAVLPGFPTSAIFTFRTFLVPALRSMAGLPPERTRGVKATVPMKFPSEVGRTEFAMVSLANGPNGLVAIPGGKGSGAVSAFSQADGFMTIDALSGGIEAGETHSVTLLAPELDLPDLVVAGSHCVGLDALVTASGLNVRTLALGSLGGLSAFRRGEAELAPIHLMDPVSGLYNQHLVPEGAMLHRGWTRLQGVAFRPDDARFVGLDLASVQSLIARDKSLMMVNRNQGAGTRVLIDRILGGQRPRGHANQPRSHNAVAAAVSQGRADWGVTIETVARAYGLGFIAIADEAYDFVVSKSPSHSAQRFLDALENRAFHMKLGALGFRR